MRACRTIRDPERPVSGCSFPVFLHEETEVETDCGPLVVQLHHLHVDVLHLVSAHADPPAWMIIGAAFQVVLSTLRLGERRWTR